MTSRSRGGLTLPRVVYVAVAACVLGAGCSRQAAPPQERAPATDWVSPASPPAATAATQVSIETAIQDIRSRYADLRRRRSSFREIKRDLTGLSTEGGMLQAFMDGEALKILEATFYGETGRAYREFYYDASGRPFFVLEVDTGYEAPFGATGGRREYRYYFYDGRLIRLLAGDGQVSPDEAAYAARVKNVLDWSRRLWDVARSP